MIPPPLVGVADPPSLAALELLWKARALRCLDLARMVFHIRVAHASSPFDPPVHEYAGCGWERLGQRILRVDTVGRPASTGNWGRLRTWKIAHLPSTGCAKRCDCGVGIARDRRSPPRPGGGPRHRPRSVPQRHPKLIQSATRPRVCILGRGDPARSGIEASLEPSPFIHRHLRVRSVTAARAAGGCGSEPLSCGPRRSTAPVEDDGSRRVP